MSDLKPCPVLHSNDGTIRERCAKCPNRRAESQAERELREALLQSIGNLLALIDGKLIGWPSIGIKEQARELLAKNQVGQPDGRR